MDARLTRRAVKVNWRHLALGHEVFEADGATFVRNTSLPGIYDANFVFGISASDPEDIDRLLARARLEYAHAERVTFRVDPFTPPAFEARLVLEGYSRTEAIVLVLEGPVRGRPRTVDILPIASDLAWNEYAELKRSDWREHAARIGLGPGSIAIADALIRSNMVKCSPVEYVMAYQDGRPVGFCSMWEGLEGMGQVEDLFVHPAYRRRGIATALIDTCVERMRARGTGPVMIVADATDTPKDMYVALGWSPVAICRQYGKTFE